MANKPIIQHAQLTDENGVAAVTVATGGAVTVGSASPGDASISHFIYGVDLAIDNKDSTSAVQSSISHKIGGVLKFQTGVDSNFGAGGYFWYNGSAYMGGITSAGAWTLGPTTGSISHTINIPTDGNYVRITGQGYSAYHVLDATAYTIGQNSGSRSLRIGSGTNYMTTGVSLSSGGTTWGTYSDIRLKRDISALSYGLNEIISINPVFFNYKVDEEGTQRRLGFKAQEIAQIIPEAVSEESGEDKYLSVASAEFIPVLVKAIQELSAKVDSLQAELNTLKGQ